MAMPYSKEIDYQAEINKAASEGSYAKAGILEKQRNSKIDAGDGGDYQKTNNYEKYIPGYMPKSSKATAAPTSSNNDPYAADKALLEKKRAEMKRKAFEDKYSSIMNDGWTNKNDAATQSAQSAQNFYEGAAASGLNSGAISQRNNASTGGTK